MGLGRKRFERVVENADELSTLPEIQQLVGRSTQEWSREEWPFFEILGYVARRAHSEVTGREDSLGDALRAHEGYRIPSGPRPTGERWGFEDEAETGRRLPRLSLMFPLSSLGSRDARSREAIERLLAERGQTLAEFVAQFTERPGKVDRQGEGAPE